MAVGCSCHCDCVTARLTQFAIMIRRTNSGAFFFHSFSLQSVNCDISMSCTRTHTMKPLKWGDVCASESAVDGHKRRCSRQNGEKNCILGPAIYSTRYDPSKSCNDILRHAGAASPNTFLLHDKIRSHMMNSGAHTHTHTPSALNRSATLSQWQLIHLKHFHLLSADLMADCYIEVITIMM